MLQSDSEKYGRELSQDCSFKRVMSTWEPTFIEADEKMCRNKATLNCQRDQDFNLTLTHAYYLIATETKILRLGEKKTGAISSRKNVQKYVSLFLNE